MSGQSLTVAPQDRLGRALRSFIRQQLARLFTYGMYEYSVTTSDGTTADMTPIDTTIPLPGLTGIPLRLCGMTAKPAAGQKVILAFLNGDPTRPIVLSNDPKPTNAAVDASSALALGGSASTVSVGNGSATTTINGATVSLAGGVSPSGQLTYASAFTSLVGVLETFAGAIAASTSVGQVAAAGGTMSSSLPATLTGANTVKTTAA